EISFSKGRHHSASRLFAGRRTLQWIQNQTEWLSDEAEWGQLRAKYGSEPGQLTGIVTHAGKRGGDYMDHAIMLGRSLVEKLPEFPRVAITVEGISEHDQDRGTRSGARAGTSSRWRTGAAATAGRSARPTSWAAGRTASRSCTPSGSPSRGCSSWTPTRTCSRASCATSS
ncbi:unnamed protein product, partial [Prorocentrum cordatum]